MLVLVLNVLMPLAAQAMLTSTGAGDTIEICTSTGMVRIPTDDPENPDKSGAGQSCPFCLSHGGQVLLPTDPQPLLMPQAYAEMPPAFYQAARTSAVWLAALSRGPPPLLN